MLKTVLTRHGNAARLAWSDDGKALFLANEEGVMSAVKFDVSDLTKPRIVATSGQVNFLWATAQRRELLVFHPSLGGELMRVDPKSFGVSWKKKVGDSHAVETDGYNIFLPLEGKPGNLVVLRADGSELARVSHPDGWWRVYSTVFDESTGILYVGAGENPASGFPGGIYLYNVMGATPVFLGKIPVPGWDIAARGTRVWRQYGDTIETWDVANPSNPKLLGSWKGSPEVGPGGTRVQPQFGHMTVNRAGTRLYAAYRSVTVDGGNQVLDWHSGFKIFDVTGSAPRLLVRQGWKTPAGYWIQPCSVALSPDNTVLAVSYWAFGVRLFRVSSDHVVDLGMAATTGEARDVYVDNLGFVHVFANDNIQTIDPQSGEHVGAFVTGTGMQGGWRPFKDGTIILPSSRNGHGRYILRIENGTIVLVTALGNPGPTTWDEVFTDPYLYSGTDVGLSIQEIGTYDPVAKKYPMNVVGSVAIGGSLIAIAKQGRLVWGLGPKTGVVAIDVSNPSAPRLVFHDRFTFEVNGNHAGIVVARGRVYAGAGDAGIIVYNPSTLRHTGTITGFNVNFLDKVGEDFLVVANYWWPRLPEGVYVYDLRSNPDVPLLVEWFPQPKGNANFRARVVGQRIYRVPLYGVDILEVR